MKPMISSLGALSAILILAAPIAQAQSCSQQAAQLQEQQMAAQEMADARQVMVEEVEAAGDAWENAETMRNFGSEEATLADENKMTYEALKADLLNQEVALQALVVSLNDEVAAYNQKCVRN
nr:hypothetical protein [Hyphomonas sp. Mor2]